MGISVDINMTLGRFTLDVRFSGKSKRLGILGASGCGKSMTLKCLAGIERPDCGKIVLNDRVLFDSSEKIDIRPQERNVGFMFQNYALFPTMTVAQNVASGLGKPDEDTGRRVEEMLTRFRLEGFADRYPDELSGGQQQRVAMARIMAYRPDIILLDEPFSALDVFLKDQMERELEEMLDEYPGMMIMVSHSRDEIFRFCDDVIVMKEGSVSVHKETEGLFADPVTQEASILTGCKNHSDIHIIDDHTFSCIDWGGEVIHVSRSIPPDADCIGYRAHFFEPVWGEREENCVTASLMRVSDLPFEREYYFDPQGKPGGREGCGHDGRNDSTIAWFVPKKAAEELEKKGMPDYLKLREDKILFLKK